MHTAAGAIWASVGQGHFDMHPGGDHLLGGQPALPPDPQITITVNTMDIHINTYM